MSDTGMVRIQATTKKRHRGKPVALERLFLVLVARLPWMLVSINLWSSSHLLHSAQWLRGLKSEINSVLKIFPLQVWTRISWSFFKVYKKKFKLKWKFNFDVFAGKWEIKQLPSKKRVNWIDLRIVYTRWRRRYTQLTREHFFVIRGPDISVWFIR